MKKRVFGIFGAVFAILFFAVFLGCKGTLERYSKIISELRDNVFVGETENFSITASSGLREVRFEIDGVATGKQEFLLISIFPKIELEIQNVKWQLKCCHGEFEGVFIRHPFLNSLSAEIEKRTSQDTLQLTLLFQEKQEQVELKSVVTYNMIGAEKALEIMERHHKSSINKFKSSGSLNAEVFIRLIANPFDNSGGYFWHIAFVGRCLNIVAALVDPISMQIVAVRTPHTLSVGLYQYHNDKL